MGNKVALGSKVRDVVTGVEGIATARFEWLTGCERIEVQPQELKDGKPVESTTFDVNRLVVLQAPTAELASISAATKDNGGPSDHPRQPSGAR